ncbi:MAG: ATP synthase F0 subunit B [Acidobacteriota bacterium]
MPRALFDRFCVRPLLLPALLILAGSLAGVVPSLAQHEAEQHALAEGTDSGDHAKHGESPWSLVFQWSNFLMLFGGLGYYLRKPLLEFLEARSKSIAEGLDSGRRAQEAAAARLAEIEKQLLRLGDEIEAIKTKAMEDAREEKARILASAKLEAQKLMELTQREIEGLQRAARLELKAQIAHLAVERAQQRLERTMAPEDHERVISRFIRALDTIKN